MRWRACACLRACVCVCPFNSRCFVPFVGYKKITSNKTYDVILDRFNKILEARPNAKPDDKMSVKFAAVCVVGTTLADPGAGPRVNGRQ